jgi:hypothetical protein
VPDLVNFAVQLTNFRACAIVACRAGKGSAAAGNAVWGVATDQESLDCVAMANGERSQTNTGKPIAGKKWQAMASNVGCQLDEHFRLTRARKLCELAYVLAMARRSF